MNFARLAGDWARAAVGAAADLRVQAVAWVEAELDTLDRLLGQRPAEAVAFREALRRLDGVTGPADGSGKPP